MKYKVNFFLYQRLSSLARFIGVIQ